MTFFRFKKNIYPIIAILSGISIVICGLIMAKSYMCTYFLICCYFLFMIFGCHRACFRILPGALVVGGIFFLIFYLATGKFMSALGMFNRMFSFFVASIPGMSTSTVAMTRNLSTLHTPRSITLGMLISMSFIPMLKGEINRVREAMKTRGAGGLWNPKILYRALLIPLVMRLVNISDTLALSVETRGFSLRKVPYTIYKKENITVSDVIFAILLITLATVAFLMK